MTQQVSCGDLSRGGIVEYCAIGASFDYFFMRELWKDGGKRLIDTNKAFINTLKKCNTGYQLRGAAKFDDRVFFQRIGIGRDRVITGDLGINRLA